MKIQSKTILHAGSFILALFFLTSACAPAQVPQPTALPVIQSSATQNPTETPKPTETVAPTATAIPPTSTFTPIPPTATPTPGPELSKYLPDSGELSKCQWIQLTVSLIQAGIWCNQVGNISLSVNVSIMSTPIKSEDLKLYSAYQPITIEKIGDGSIAGIDDSGKEANIAFIKNNAQVNIDIYNPRGKVNMDDAVEAAKITDAKITSEINPPVLLSYPENLLKDKLKTYFSKLSLLINATGQAGQEKVSNEITEEGYMCLDFTPVKRSRDYMTAALYDLQKKEIVTKTSYEMYSQKSCGGLEPRYVKGTYKAGDQYEIRIAVGEDLVAVMPFVTK